MKYTSFIALILIIVMGCKSESSKSVESEIQSLSKPLITEKKFDSLTTTIITEKKFDSLTTTIHILVALCDNENQGIVPVPKSIGNGQDPKNNLYWGTAYGIKTYFKKSKEWKLIKSIGKNGYILERVIFKHLKKDIYIVADAYDGMYIKQTTLDFLDFSSGKEKNTLEIDDKTIGIGGNAKLIAYIGHDGLMDFQINEKFENIDGIRRDVIVLACYSKSYFEPHLQQSNVNPLVWTTGLMAPEAYTIHDAISGYAKNETNDAIRIRAAKAYSKYQKCSLNAAKRLLVTN